MNTSSNLSPQGNHTRALALVGLMASLIFVATSYIHIPIPSPTGMTMIKSGNILCLLAGLTLGKVHGGLAAGLGSMLFDLTNPLYISSAPVTFVNFFLMAFVAGFIFEKTQGKFRLALPVSCVVGAFFYVLLYFSKSVLGTCMMGSALVPALIANATKLVTSSFNATIASIFATVLYPTFVMILQKSRVLR